MRCALARGADASTSAAVSSVLVSEWHTPADPSPSQDLSLRRLWVHVQSNTAEVRLASSSLVGHVNVAAENLHQVLSTWLSRDASSV